MAADAGGWDGHGAVAALTANARVAARQRERLAVIEGRRLPAGGRVAALAVGGKAAGAMVGHARLAAIGLVAADARRALGDLGLVGIGVAAGAVEPRVSAGERELGVVYRGRLVAERYRAGYDFKRLFTLSEYYDRNRSAFYRALQSVREQDMDLTGWLAYFAEGLATQLAEIKARGEVALRSEVVALDKGLAPRQAAVLGFVMSRRRLTVGDLESLFPDVSRRSLQRDVKELLSRGLLKEVASGPTDPGRHYVLGEL